MKAHIQSNIKYTKDLQKLYTTKIPLYRLNKPKLFIQDFTNKSQRFTYNQKLHKFTEQTNNTQNTFDYEFSGSSNIVKLKKKTKDNHFNNFNSPKKKKIELIFEQRGKVLKQYEPVNKQKSTITQFPISFLNSYSKQKEQRKTCRKVRTNNFNQSFFQEKYHNFHNNRFNYSKKQNFFMKQNSSRLFNQTSQINQMSKKKQMHQKQLKRQAKVDKEIKTFFQFIHGLNKLGYMQQKVDQWISHYIITKKTIFKDIFLKQKGFNRASSAQIQYGIQSQDVVRHKAKQYKRIINFKEIGLQIDDLKQLNSFIQDILIQKQFFQLKRIDDYVQQKTKAIQHDYEDLKDQKSLQIKKIIQKYEKRKKINPSQYYEAFNFFDDVKRMQDLYGPIKGMNRSNRRIFEDLTKIEINSHKKVNAGQKIYE